MTFPSLTSNPTGWLATLPIRVVIVTFLSVRFVLLAAAGLAVVVGTGLVGDLGGGEQS